MARVVGHLRVEELQAGYRGSGDGTLARHYQVIWLLVNRAVFPGNCTYEGALRR